MTSPLPIAPARREDLAALLTARLRPSSPSPVILVDPSDPVIGGPQCMVAACERLAVLAGKCSAHHRRWVDDGRPGIRGVGGNGPGAAGGGCNSPASARSTTCRRARREFGLCHSHAVRWRQPRPSRPGTLDRRGRRWRTPAVRASVATFPAVNLTPRAAAGLCGHHRGRWMPRLAARRSSPGC